MTDCKKCKGLISTQEISQVKKLKPYSLFTDYCNACAGKEDVKTTIEVIRKGQTSYTEERFNEMLEKLYKKYPNLLEDRK